MCGCGAVRVRGDDEIDREVRKGRLCWSCVFIQGSRGREGGRDEEEVHPSIRPPVLLLSLFSLRSLPAVVFGCFSQMLYRTHAVFTVFIYSLACFALLST